MVRGIKEKHAFFEFIEFIKEREDDYDLIIYMVDNKRIHVYAEDCINEWKECLHITKYNGNEHNIISLNSISKISAIKKGVQ